MDGDQWLTSAGHGGDQWLITAGHDELLHRKRSIYLEPEASETLKAPIKAIKV